MNSYYPIAGLVLLAVLLLIVFLIRKNKKDQKEFENDVIQSELKPDKHEEEKE